MPLTKLLLVEDNPADARIIREMLKEASPGTIELLLADRLDRGLEALRQSVPDLVLLDLGLPDSQGLATLQEACAAFPTTPFVVLTGLNDQTIASEAVRAGAQDYLVKGRINCDMLIRTVRYAVERHRFHRALLEDEARKGAVLQAALDGIISMDHEGRVLEFNAAAERMFGYSAAEVVGREMAEMIIPPAYRERHRRGLAHYLATGHGPVMGKRVEMTALRSDGMEFPVELAITRINTDSPPVFTGFIRDISEVKRVEEEQRKAAERLHEVSSTKTAVLNALPAHIALMDSQGVIVAVNEAWRQFASANALQSPDFCVGRNYLEVCEHAHGECADEAAAVAAGIRKMLRDELKEFSIEYPCHSPAEKRWFRLMVTPLNDTPRAGVVVMHVNVTERRLAEEILKESERAQRRLAEALTAETRRLHESQAVANIGSWETDVATLAAKWTPETFRIFRITPEQFEPSHPGFLEFVHPDDRQRVDDAFMQSFGRPGPFAIEHRILLPGGKLKHVEERWQTFNDPTGKPVRAVGTCQDVTERRQLEEQFRQSQKMEAVGQLAGGVAHDFNNILAVIMMQAELTAMTESLPDTAQDGLRQIREAAERAARLTRQLLLFSRKQVMQSHQLDLNEIVTGLAKMLQRIIGEDVRLQLNLHSRPLFTRADAGMLDQVLMNLVVNARDAMPGGGQLFIETSEKIFSAAEAAAIPDAVPGRYVCLRVTDTGCGVAPEHLSRIFEPFFTTKESGKGTGLGLATVFGIIKQHNGALTVESEVGKGTTFRLFLRAEEATAQSRAEAAVKHRPRGGTEVVLLVEDEPSVRMLTRVVLERAGYQVVEATNGVEALRIWERATAKIQLLLTDVVMPEGIGGRELAARLREKTPGLRVIFTSGYSADVAGREFPLDEGENFIQKPASPDLLLETVRRSLDS